MAGIGGFGGGRFGGGGVPVRRGSMDSGGFTGQGGGQGGFLGPISSPGPQGPPPMPKGPGPMSYGGPMGGVPRGPIGALPGPMGGGPMQQRPTGNLQNSLLHSIGGGGKGPETYTGPMPGQDRFLHEGQAGTGKGGTDLTFSGAPNMLPNWAQNFRDKVNQNKSQSPAPKQTRNRRMGMF